MKSELAKARDRWLESKDGAKCCEGKTHGIYLKNRLERAFIAGWDAFSQELDKSLEEDIVGDDKC